MRYDRSSLERIVLANYLQNYGKLSQDMEDFVTQGIDERLFSGVRIRIAREINGFIERDIPQEAWYSLVKSADTTENKFIDELCEVLMFNALVSAKSLKAVISELKAQIAIQNIAKGKK